MRVFKLQFLLWLEMKLSTHCCMHDVMKEHFRVKAPAVDRPYPCKSCVSLGTRSYLEAACNSLHNYYGTLLIHCSESARNYTGSSKMPTASLEARAT